MSGRRHVILFQPRFAAAVQSGAKLQTIRPWRRRMIDVGDVVDLRAWTGLPYRSKPRQLREAMVCEKSPILINVTIGRDFTQREVILGYNGKRLDDRALLAFAVADGFTGPEEFFGFFIKAYSKATRFGTKLSFHGQLIRWQP
jgi:hypothetical protein